MSNAARENDRAGSFFCMNQEAGNRDPVRRGKNLISRFIELILNQLEIQRKKIGVQAVEGSMIIDKKSPFLTKR